MRRIKIFLSFLLFFPAAVYALEDSGLRDKAMEATLLAMEVELPASSTPNPTQINIEEQKNNFTQRGINENIEWLEFSDNESEIYLTLGLQIGYLKGYTAYDWNHHTSELEFPMNNVMGGGSFSLGYKDLSLNAQAWVPVEDYAGFEMKDKDWTRAGVLISYTKSKAYMDAIIWDANLRYNFYKKVSAQEEDLSLLDENYSVSDLKFDEIKVGVLLGYKYERFDYDVYEIRYPYPYYVETTTHQGTKVLTYNIKYYLPYIGVATDLLRQNWGVNFNIKYSFYPTARHVDNHLLRYLTLYADYERGEEREAQAWIGSINGFCEFIKNWKLKLGADWTFIRIDGVHWDATHDPGWNGDVFTDSRQWLFWSGIEYKF